MRQIQAMVIALVGGCLGCGGMDSIRPQVPVPPPTMRSQCASPSDEGDSAPAQVVVLDTAVLECPYGDRFLSEELWQHSDEHVDLDVQPVLEENGLRVGRIGGMLPGRLQALLASSRSCPQPRRIRAELEKPTELLIGTQQPELDVQFRDADRSSEIKLRNAQCLFEVVPSPAEEDRVKLRIRPRVRHGRALLAAHVAHEPGGPLHWSMEPTEPVEDFPSLVWELSIRSDELIFVGARLDRPGTIGPACFLSGTDSERKQRVLVLRASLLISTDPVAAPAQAPPLAAQASLTARGSRP